MAQANENKPKKHRFTTAIPKTTGMETLPKKKWKEMAKHRSFLDEMYIDDLYAVAGISRPEDYKQKEETVEQRRKRIATYYIIETSLPLVRAGTVTSRGNFPAILRAVLQKVKRNRAQIINRNVIDRMVEKCSRLNPLPVTIDILYEIAGICPPALRENTPIEPFSVVVDLEARTCVVKACMPHVEAGTILPNINFTYILNDIVYIAMCTYHFGPRHIADLVRKFIPLYPVYQPEHRADPLTCLAGIRPPDQRGPVSGESRPERLQREVREAIVDACRPHCQAGTIQPKRNFVPILETTERMVLPTGRVDRQEIAHLVQKGIQKFPAPLEVSEPPAEDMEE